MPEPLVYPEGMNPAYQRTAIFAREKYRQSLSSLICLPVIFMEVSIITSSYYHIRGKLVQPKAIFDSKCIKIVWRPVGGLTTPSPETLAYGITGGKGGQVGVK